MPTPDYGPYWYVQILPPIPAPSPVDGPPVVTSERLLVEHALVDAKAPAQRADLADGRRVYRLQEFFLWLMPKDQTGRFVWAGVERAKSGAPGAPVAKKLYWSATSPVTATDVLVRDWVLVE